MRYMSVGLLALLLCACGTGRTTVLERPQVRLEASGVEILMEDPLVPVPEEIISRFTSALDDAFFAGEAGFVRGSDIKLRWRFVQFEPGSRFARWLTAGIGNAGEASLITEIRFLGPDDTMLARISVEGRIGSGFFGGSLGLALDKAAAEAADYAVANFR